MYLYHTFLPYIMFIFLIIKKKTLTENFTCSGDKIICFGIFIYDSNEELTLNIKLGLPPENKVKLLFTHCKCHRCKWTVTVDNMFRQPIQWLCLFGIAFLFLHKSQRDFCLYEQFNNNCWVFICGQSVSAYITVT